MIFGYLDPVTGNALLQLGLAALAAVGLGWQYVRRAFRSLVARVRPRDQAKETLTEATQSASETNT